MRLLSILSALCPSFPDHPHFLPQCHPLILSNAAAVSSSAPLSISLLVSRRSSIEGKGSEAKQSKGSYEQMNPQRPSLTALSAQEHKVCAYRVALPSSPPSIQTSCQSPYFFYTALLFLLISLSLSSRLLSSASSSRLCALMAITSLSSSQWRCSMSSLSICMVVLSL